MSERFAPWPFFFSDAKAPLRAVVDELARSQYWSAHDLRCGQRHQLAGLLRWAAAQSPFYAALANQAQALSDGRNDPVRFDVLWRELPILTKAQLRSQRDLLDARTLPPSQQPITTTKTSGSTGTPVELRTTQLTKLVWEALAVREHLWQGRDFRKRLGVIRYQMRIANEMRGMRLPTWGVPVENLYVSGPGSVIHIGQPIAILAAWLIDFDPHYLLASPTIVGALLDQLPAPPPALEEIRFAFEAFDTELETRVAEHWGMHCTELYSANEVGHIAFRCREGGQLHVQAESVLVEIIDDQGQPCAAGVSGRVIVTALHNYATPLVRYELGDYASFGQECRCGRQLPIIDKVRGRVRNLARRPDGSTFWPGNLKRVGALAAVRQTQYVQTAIDSIELRLVLERPLSGAEMARAVTIVQDALGYPYHVNVVAVDVLTYGPTGKFEEFLSLI